jgi:hypothetical protein
MPIGNGRPWQVVGIFAADSPELRKAVGRNGENSDNPCWWCPWSRKEPILRGHKKHPLFDRGFLVLWGERAEQLDALYQQKAVLNKKIKEDSTNEALKQQLKQIRRTIIECVQQWLEDGSITTLEQAETAFSNASKGQKHRPMMEGPIFLFVPCGLHMCISCCKTLLWVSWDTLRHSGNILVQLLEEMRQWHLKSISLVIDTFI